MGVATGLKDLARTTRSLGPCHLPTTMLPNQSSFNTETATPGPIVSHFGSDDQSADAGDSQVSACGMSGMLLTTNRRMREN